MPLIVTSKRRVLAPQYSFPFLFGFAVSNDAFLNQIERAILDRHAVHFVPEICMKPEYLFPAEGEYNFAAADTFVLKVSARGGTIRLHTFFWAAMRAWVFTGTLAQVKSRITVMWTAFRDHYVSLLGTTEFNRLFKVVEVANEVCRKVSGSSAGAPGSSPAAAVPWKTSDQATYLGLTNDQYAPLYAKFEADTPGSGPTFVAWLAHLAHSLFPSAILQLNDGHSEWTHEATANQISAITTTRAALATMGSTATIDSLGCQGHFAPWQTPAQVRGAAEIFLQACYDNFLRPSWTEPDWTTYGNGEAVKDWGEFIPDDVMASQYARAEELGKVMREWYLAHPSGRGAILEFTPWMPSDNYAYLKDTDTMHRTAAPTFHDAQGNAKPTFTRWANAALGLT